MKKILIFGSNSFPSVNLINKILSMEIEIIGISRSKEKNIPFNPYLKHPLKNKLLNFYNLNINHNLDDITKIIEKEKPDTILDFAAQSMVAESWIWPEDWFQTNVLSKVKLLQFLKNKNFLKQYIRISTPEVYGSHKSLIKENFKYNPSTPYAVSQACLDMYLKIYFENYKFPIIFTRFSNFYGPHQQVYRIIPKAIISCILNKKIPLHGGGRSVRSFIYNDDVSDAILKVLEKGKHGEVYHFSTNEFVTIKDLIKRICNKLDLDFNKIVEYSTDRLGKDYSYMLKTTKAKDELDWKPKFSLDDGLDLTINWAQENINLLYKKSMNYNHKK